MFGKIKRLWWRKVPTDTSTGGQEARERAERELQRVKAETPYYSGLGQDLRTLRDRNHLAERIRENLRARPT